MIELHIWGPAFGLPSIDAECLAAVIYLNSVLPANSWHLIPSSNPSLNPFQQLPALRNDNKWVAGFEHISNYLSKHSNGTWNLNRNLSSRQAADCDAFTSFLHSRGLPLLDLSLYVSSDNYTTCTRSALGELLAWPQSWVVPHQIRERAKRRSDHLGLSALDVDSVQEDKNEDAGLTAQIPKSLRKPRRTVSALLGRGAQKTRFRMTAVMDDFLEPLSAKLARNEWLVGNRLTSVDCLAIAILSLMQARELPQSWLRDGLSSKYPALNDWAYKHSASIYGGVVSVSQALRGESPDNKLPWKSPALLSWPQTGLLAVEAVIGGAPVFRWGYECHELPEQDIKSKHDSKQKQELYQTIRNRQRLYSLVVGGCLSTATVLGWMAQVGLLTISRLQAGKPSRRSFGEAGAILGI